MPDPQPSDIDPPLETGTYAAPFFNMKIIPLKHRHQPRNMNIYHINEIICPKIIGINPKTNVSQDLVLLY